LTVALEAYELRRIDRDVLAWPPQRDLLLDDPDRLLERDSVDRAPQDLGAPVCAALVGPVVLPRALGDCSAQRPSSLGPVIRFARFMPE
jgi:hypothetical protein